MSHDPNSIRLYPIDFNQIVRTQNVNEIDLLLDPFIPAGWKPNPGSEVIGGADIEPDIDKSTDAFGTADKGSGNR